MRLFSSLSEWYFKPKWPESDSLYRRLGLGLFLRYLPNGGTLYNLYFWRMMGIRRPYQSKAYLIRTEAASRMHEGGHLLVALIMLALTVASLCSHAWTYALIMGGLNLTLNIYPIMLQRWKRLRILRILASKYPSPLPKAPKP